MPDSFCSSQSQASLALEYRMRTRQQKMQSCKAFIYYLETYIAGLALHKSLQAILVGGEVLIRTRQLAKKKMQSCKALAPSFLGKR